MSTITSKGDECLLIVQPEELPEINDTWITELVEAHYGKERKWKARVQVLMLLNTWEETTGRTFDV